MVNSDLVFGLTMFVQDAHRHAFSPNDDLASFLTVTMPENSSTSHPDKKRSARNSSLRTSSPVSDVQQCKVQFGPSFTSAHIQQAAFGIPREDLPSLKTKSSYQSHLDHTSMHGKDSARLLTASTIQGRSECHSSINTTGRSDEAKSLNETLKSLDAQQQDVSCALW